MTFRPLVRFFGLVGIGLLTGNALAAAQSADVAIRGVVTDESRAAVPGVTMTATNTETGLQRTTTTDTAGRYIIASVPAGTYDISAELPGFVTVIRRQQTFNVGTTITIDFSMLVAGLAETVEVRAVAPVLEATNSTVSRIVQKAEIDALPVINRNFSDLAALAPGVQATGGAVSIGNSFASQTGYRVDGVSTQGWNTGGQVVPFAQDWIQEFSVVTRQFSAEYGQASGGVVNAVTRSGSNRVAGRWYSFFQSDKLNATPAFVAQKDPFSKKRLGGMIGGPLVKDKLFYFGGVEWTRQDQHAVVVSTFPSANGTYPANSDEKLAIVKLDYQAAAGNMVRGRVNTQRASAIGSGIGGTSTPEHGTTDTNLADNVVTGWTWTATPKTLSEARFGFLRSANNSVCNASVSRPAGPWFEISYPGAQFGCSAAWGGPVQQRQYQIYENVSSTQGAHQIKAGGYAIRSDFDTQLRNNVDGRYLFNQDIPFSIANAASYPSQFIIFQGPRIGFKINSWSYGGFVQDSWQMTNDFTLNVGVRYDFDQTNSAINKFVQSDRGFHSLNNDPNNVAPRAAIAWTPFNDDKRTLLRGGLSVNYDEGHNQVAAVYMSNTVNIDKQIQLNANSPLLNPFWPDIARLRQVLATSLAANAVPDVSAIPGLTSAAFDVDRNIQIPYTVQATGGMQRNVSDRVDVSVDYSYIRGLDQLLKKNVNLTPGTFTKINPLFTTVDSWGNEGWFTSKSLLSEARFRIRQADSVRVAYTLGFARSNTNGGTSSRTASATNPFNLAEDEGPADNDVRHILNVNGSTTLPLGIQFASIMSYKSALPYSATTTVQAPGAADPFIHRPESRNARRGDDSFSLDVRLSRPVRLGGARAATAFLEGFNVTNATNYTTYQGSILSSRFGQPSAAGSKRQLQVGFRFDF